MMRAAPNAHARMGARPWRPLVLLLGGSLLLRMVLALLGGYYFDLNAFEEWAAFLATHPLSAFYTFSSGTLPDHLPGDMLVLAGLGRGFASVFGVGRIDSDGFDWLLKMVGVMSDFAVGGCIYAIVRRLRPDAPDRAALTAAGWWLLNPAVIFLSAIWGQWDAFSLALLMFAAVLCVQGRVVSPWLPFAWACLVKPQLAALAPVLLIFLLREHGSDRAGRVRLAGRIAVGCLLGVVLVSLISAPFDVGLPGTAARWDLIDRVTFAVDRHPVTSAGAFNLWALIGGSGSSRTLDESVHVLGLTAREFSMVLTGLALLIGYGIAARIRDARLALIWGSLFVTLTLYLLPTRIHERYLLPALPFAAILVGLPVVRHTRWLAAGLTVPFFISLYLAYDQSFPLLDIPGLRSPAVWHTLPAVLLLLYLCVGAVGVGLVHAGARTMRSRGTRDLSAVPPD